MILYHYTTVDKPVLTIDPKKFNDHHYYSNSEYKASSIPRSFWYTNSTDREDFFDNGILYIADIPDSKIYDLKQDELGLQEKSSDAHDLLSKVPNRYSGVLYNVGYDVVSMFVSVKATRSKKQPALYAIKKQLEQLIN